MLDLYDHYPGDVVQRVRDDGYAVVRANHLNLSHRYLHAFQKLVTAWDRLPLDPYLRGGQYRRRRHGSFVCRAGNFEAYPSGGYFQSAGVNNFAGGVRRKFASLEPQDANNPFLLSLLYHNVWLFEQVLRRGPSHWNLDVHFVRVTGKPGEVGLPSPEGPHRDGFDYIALHHVRRKNISGGVTTIYNTHGELVKQLEMREPLDTLYAQDDRILHDVSPIRGIDSPGCRDMILTSYNLLG